MANTNFVVKNGITVNGAFTANSTAVNASAVTVTTLASGANVSVNTTSVFVGNSTVNTNITNGQISFSGVTVNSTIYQGTANNSSYLGTVAAASYQLTGSSLTANIAAYLTTYTGIVNASSFTVGSTFVSNATTVQIGSTSTTAFVVNSSTISVGNTTVNTFSNSSHFFAGNSTYYGLGNNTVEGIVSPTSNVFINSTAIFIGNSGTNAVINSTAISMGSIFSISATGNVGIGTSTPSYRLTVTGDIMTNRGTTSGSILLGNSGTSYLYYDGTNYNLGGTGSLTINGATAATQSYVTSLGFANATNNLGISGNATNITGTYIGTISSSQITTGLGFTPYNSTNPSSFANATNGLGINGSAYNISAYTINQSVGTGNSPTFTGLTTSSNTSTFGTSLYIISSGNVGIGTSTPAYNLDVSGNIRATQIAGTLTTASQPNITANNSTNFGGLSLTTIQGQISGNAATAYSNAVANAAALYYLNSNPSSFANATNSLNINGTATNITAYTINQSVGTGNSPTFTGLSTSTNTFTVGTAAYHVANGNLGIGTSSPSTKLSVNGAQNAPSGTSAVGIGRFQESSGGNCIDIGFNYVSGVSTYGWIQSHDGGGTSTYYTLAMNPLGGNVGIGTSSPGYTLDINGNARVVTSLGVGTTPSGTGGEIRATNNITAYYSDKRLKNVIGSIPNALQKVSSLSGVIYTPNDLAATYGYTDKAEQVGVIAQEVESVLPQVVKPAPFDTEFIDGIETSISGHNYMTVQYEKLVPLLIEAIKELKQELDELKSKVS